MENPKNKSIDNLKNEAVNGGEIKGGNSVVFAPTGEINPITGEVLPMDANSALNQTAPADPLPINMVDPGLPLAAAADMAVVSPDFPGNI